MFEISFALSLTDSGYPRRSARSRRSAFARLTRYSASDIAPAIATAVAPSREKIFWTTLDPTKKPFDARLSAARTTPSLLRIPTVVVMSNLNHSMSRVGYVDSKGPGPVTNRDEWPATASTAAGPPGQAARRQPGSGARGRCAGPLVRLCPGDEALEHLHQADDGYRAWL